MSNRKRPSSRRVLVPSDRPAICEPPPYEDVLLSARPRLGPSVVFGDDLDAPELSSATILELDAEEFLRRDLRKGFQFFAHNKEGCSALISSARPEQLLGSSR